MRRMLCCLGSYYLYSCLLKKENKNVKFHQQHSIGFSNNRNVYLQEWGKNTFIVGVSPKLRCNMCMMLGSEVQITSFRVSKLGMHLFCYRYKKSSKLY